MLPLGPAGLWADIVTLLNREVASILEEPNVRASGQAAGAKPLFGAPQQVADLITPELNTRGALVTELGISFE